MVYSDFLDFSVAPVTVTVDKDLSSADHGYWNNLVGEEIQVQASVRQDSDPNWIIPDSDWKIQVWT